MRYIDLFCGIGGFHAALSRLGHECVFACDVDEETAKMYELNFGIAAHQDIRNCSEIPDFDILCAGFPCQPFSKSGSQEGFNDETRGTLFHEILRIIKISSPQIIFLENVANMKSHNKGNTYQIIQKSIEGEGYRFFSDILSPHHFGTPQIRKRLFMIAIKESICPDEDFEFPREFNIQTNISTILDEVNFVEKKYFLSEREIEILDTWNYFIQNIGSEINPPSPTWSQDFGLTYPLEKIHPISKQSRITLFKMKKLLISDGIIPSNSGLRKNTINQFPPYISSAIGPLPEWKKKFIQNNRDMWNLVSNDIGAQWLKKIRTFEQTYQKFEWQVGDENRDIWDHIIQFRPSGIRVKKRNYIPALVAIAQIPIIGWEKRRMTPKECARAQDFDVDGIFGKKYIVSSKDNIAYKQIGNAVNVNLIYLIMKSIDNYIQKT